MIMYMSCAFCEKTYNHDDILFDNDQVLVMLDQDRAVAGHTLVVWKSHVQNLSDLSPSEAIEFTRVLYETEEKLLQALQLPRSVMLKSGFLESHFHFHIYPVTAEMEWEQVLEVINKKVRMGDDNDVMRVKRLFP